MHRSVTEMRRSRRGRERVSWGCWGAPLGIELYADGLSVFLLGAGLVALSHQGTAERIARNEREALLEQLERVPARRAGWRCGEPGDCCSR